MTLFPAVGSDVEYAFIITRSQLTVLATIGLIFGPKVVLIMRGKGNDHDPRAKAHGISATFSLLGVSVANDAPLDVRKENEELKEELHKLASQMEYMKIVHMEVNNPHIKQGKGGYFSPSHMQGTNGTGPPTANGIVTAKVATPPVKSPFKATVTAESIVEFEPQDDGGIFLGDDEPEVKKKSPVKVATPSKDLPKATDEEIILGTPQFEGDYEWL